MRDQNHSDVPKIICPICLSVPEDPVLGLDGVTYGRNCLEKHIQEGNGKFPVGRQPIPEDYDPIPNVDIRKFTDLYLTQEQIEQRTQFYQKRAQQNYDARIRVIKKYSQEYQKLKEMIGDNINMIDDVGKLELILKKLCNLNLLLMAGIPFNEIIDFPFFEILFIQASMINTMLCFGQKRVSWQEIKTTDPEKLRFMLKQAIEVTNLICDYTDCYNEMIRARICWKEIADTELGLLKKLFKKNIRIEELATHGLTWNVLVTMSDRNRDLLLEEVVIFDLAKHSNMKIDELAILDYEILAWLIKYSVKIITCIKECKFSLQEFIHLNKQERDFFIENSFEIKKEVKKIVNPESNHPLYKNGKMISLAEVISFLENPNPKPAPIPNQNSTIVNSNKLTMEISQKDELFSHKSLEQQTKELQRKLDIEQRRYFVLRDEIVNKIYIALLEGQTSFFKVDSSKRLLYKGSNKFLHSVKDFSENELDRACNLTDKYIRFHDNRSIVTDMSLFREIYLYSFKKSIWGCQSQFLGMTFFRSKSLEKEMNRLSDEELRNKIANSLANDKSSTTRTAKIIKALMF